MRVLQLAEYVIRRATSKEKTITNLKLQKTLYYLQGYSLRAFSKCAFPEDIRKWQYGPVAPTVYFAYSSYGAEALPTNPETVIPLITACQKDLFDKVIDKCLDHTARELVQMTHEEDPWLVTTDNKEISENVLMKFFCAKNPLEIEECS